MSDIPFDTNPRIAQLRFPELARIDEQPSVGLEYATFLLRLLETPAAIGRMRVTALTPVDAPPYTVLASWPQQSSAKDFTEGITGTALDNLGLVRALADDFRSSVGSLFATAAEQFGPQTDLEGQAVLFGGPLGVYIGPQAEQIATLIRRLDELSRVARSVATQLAWEHDRVWEIFALRFRESVDYEAAIATLADANG